MLRTNFQNKDLPKYQRAIIEFKALTNDVRFSIDKNSKGVYGLYDTGHTDATLFWDIFENLKEISKPYLFKIVLWQYDPAEYVLAYGKNEEEAREKGCKDLRYNCGDPVPPNALTLVTYF